MSSIGEKLYDLRTSRGISQEDVAAGVNISRVALTRYENGQRMPKMDIVTRLASYFDVTTDYLMGNESYDLDGAASSLTSDQKEALEHFIWLLKESGDRSKVEHALWTVNSLYEQANQ